MDTAVRLDKLTAADLATHKGPVDMVKVQQEIVINTAPDVLLAQVKHNLGRGLPELAITPKRWFWERTISLCGSAPSLMHTLDQLTGKVMAINAAIPALHKAGVTVDYAMIWDATPEMVRYVCDIPGCQWLIASRVNPAVLDKLSDLEQDVTLWHCASTEPDMLDVLKGRVLVFGGGHGATRMPFLAGAMGYRDLHVFGADSSYSDETHVGGALRDENEVLVAFEGEAFRSTFWMMNQAEVWVKFVLPELVPTGMRFTMHGDGLLPAAHRSWLRQCLTPTRRFLWSWSPCW